MCKCSCVKSGEMLTSINADQKKICGIGDSNTKNSTAISDTIF